jgi:hypothetical protein
MTEKEKKDADREYNNFHTMASWNAYLSKEQTNYLFRERGDFLYCHGYGRRLIAEPLTNDTFKLYTKPF